MSERGECSHNCETCNQECDQRSRESMIEKANAQSNIKKVIGVVSGKGGVGKSLVTSLLAAAMQKKGFQTAVLDADITGPSIPKIFGITTKAMADGNGIIPVVSKEGTKIMSINLLLKDDSDPVVWRGPIIAGAVKQFWTDVNWGDVDYMFVDMPPGTGDVPLTVFQSLPVDGIVVVTSPQELVSMIVGKAVKMAHMLDIPILGIVENMSYFECPTCHEKHYIFGDSHIDELAKGYDIQTVAKLPIDKEIASLCDKGEVEKIESSYVKEIVDELSK